MPDLALDDVQRHALAQQLQRVRVPQLVRREAPAHAGAGGRGMPRATLRAAVDHAQQRPDRHRLARLQPRLELFEAPVVHADFAALSAFAAADEHGTAPAVEVELGQIERFLDAQPARQSTAINPRARSPCRPSPQQRMTAMISSVRG